MRKVLLVISVLILSWSCKDLTNERLQETEVFVKFFGEVDSDAHGVDIVQLSDGTYLLLGYTESRTGNIDGFLIETDQYGNIMGGVKIIPQFKTSSLALDANEGYYIIGDGIDPVTGLPAMRIIGKDGADFFVEGNYVSGSLTAEVHGTAMDVTTIPLALGYVEDGGSVSQVRVGLDLISKVPTWVEVSAAGPAYLPGKAILPSSDGHIWTTTRSIGGNSTAQVQFARPDEAVGNSDQPDADFGRDITNVGAGFTGIGTKGDNIIIFHTEANGNVTFTSTIEEGVGLSISSTSDGFNFVGLGSVEAKSSDRLDFDFVLIPGGGPRIYLGGTGNEIEGGVTPTLDGGYAIFGTSELDGTSSMIFIKTNKDGELKF